MNGKLVGGFIVGSAILAGAAVWYLQLYYFYTRPDPDSVEIRLTPRGRGLVQRIAKSHAEALATMDDVFQAASAAGAKVGGRTTRRKTGATGQG